MEISMKRALIITGIIVTFLLVFIYLIFMSFNGSLIHRIVFTNQTKEYVRENYPGEEWEISFAVYDFKMNNYLCHIQSPSSIDTAFNVYETQDGKPADDFEIAVINKENTIYRMARELDTLTDEIILPAYPHRTRLMMCDFNYTEEIDRSKFELDMEFDYKNISNPIELTIWVETSQSEPTWEEAAKLFREAVSITEKLGINVSYFSISVEYPYTEVEEELVPIDYNSIVGAFEVPKEIILSDKLEDFLNEERLRREQEILEMDKK